LAPRRFAAREASVRARARSKARRDAKRPPRWGVLPDEEARRGRKRSTPLRFKPGH
jgi:hypothetical protein